MKEIKHIYLADKEELHGHYLTGLVFEFADGTFMAHGSTDILQPFAEAIFTQKAHLPHPWPHQAKFHEPAPDEKTHRRHVI
jgi:hypothetical protein